MHGQVCQFENSMLPIVSGTCASIGYSNSCCPLSLGDECQAADGECRCDTNCHVYQDCCEDVHCPAGIAIAMPSLIAGSCDYVIHFRAQDVCRCGNHILLQ